MSPLDFDLHLLIMSEIRNIKNIKSMFEEIWRIYFHAPYMFVLQRRGVENATMSRVCFFFKFNYLHCIY